MTRKDEISAAKAYLATIEREKRAKRARDEFRKYRKGVEKAVSTLPGRYEDLPRKTLDKIERDENALLDKRVRNERQAKKNRARYEKKFKDEERNLPKQLPFESTEVHKARLKEEILEAFLIALDEAKLKARVYPGQGASISGDPKKAGKRKKTVPLSKLSRFEPEEKMQTPEGRAKVDNIKKAIKSGEKLPPIVVRKTKKGKQILDGHHRYQAHKELGTKKVQVARLGKRDVSTSPTPYKED